MLCAPSGCRHAKMGLRQLRHSDREERGHELAACYGLLVHLLRKMQCRIDEPSAATLLDDPDAVGETWLVGPCGCSPTVSVMLAIRAIRCRSGSDSSKEHKEATRKLPSPSRLYYCMHCGLLGLSRPTCTSLSPLR